MIDEEKLQDQAQYEWVDEGYEALPLSGPGRWMTYPDGTTIYTDDDTILFVKNDRETPIGTVEAVLAIDKLWHAGKTPTEAFEALRANVPVVSGDLSEIA